MANATQLLTAFGVFTSRIKRNFGSVLRMSQANEGSITQLGFIDYDAILTD